MDEKEQVKPEGAKANPEQALLHFLPQGHGLLSVISLQDVQLEPLPSAKGATRAILAFLARFAMGKRLTTGEGERRA